MAGGGWPDGAKWACQPKHELGWIRFSNHDAKPYRVDDYFTSDGDGVWLEYIAQCDKLSPNWHQTALSREEYFSAYPAVADADGWIEWKSPFFGEMPVDENEVVDIRVGDVVHIGFVAKNWKMWGVVTHYRLHRPAVDAEFCESVTRSIPELGAKPSIEQLASEYRNKLDYAERLQKEADAAKADAEAKLAELVEAGKVHGLAVSIIQENKDSHPIVTDRSQLELGDVIWISESTDLLNNEFTPAGEYTVIKVGVIGILCKGKTVYPDFSTREWRFIRRP